MSDFIKKSEKTDTVEISLISGETWKYKVLDIFDEHIGAIFYDKGDKILKNTDKALLGTLNFYNENKLLNKFEIYKLNLNNSEEDSQQNYENLKVIFKFKNKYFNLGNSFDKTILEISNTNLSYDIAPPESYAQYNPNIANQITETPQNYWSILGLALRQSLDLQPKDNDKVIAYVNEVPVYENEIIARAEKIQQLNSILFGSNQGWTNNPVK